MNKMDLRFCSLASGSKGNCYAIWKNDEVYLIDAGISGKKVEEGLKNIGFRMEDVKALFITHEHIDHTKSLKVLCKKNENMKVYTRKNTWANICEDKLKDMSLQDRFLPIEDEVSLDNMRVRAIELSHDAVDPIGYRFEYYDRSLVILTDTGVISEDIFHKIKDVHLLVLESNHDENILQVCDYPYNIKMRILSDFGHLSNNVAASCIDRILSYRKENMEDRDLVILLAHLSTDNNSEYLAKQTVQNIIDKKGWKPKRFALGVVRQNEASNVYKV